MTTYRVIYSDDYLEHHGILGQKWGHKNGPPYPLDQSDYSAAERKAQTGGISGDSSKSGNKFNKDTAKKVAVSVAVTAAVATGAYLAIRNKDAVNAFISSNAKKTMPQFKDAKKAVINRGRETVSTIVNAGKEWSSERKAAEYSKWSAEFLKNHPDYTGPSEIPKNLVKNEKVRIMTKEALNKIVPGTTESAVDGVAKAKNNYVRVFTTGVTMLSMKELTDIVLGRNVSGRIMKANDKDSIGKYWRYEEPTDKKSDDYKSIEKGFFKLNKK